MTLDMKLPFEVIPKGRPRFSNKTYRSYTPQRTRDFEALVRDAVKELLPEGFVLLNGPLNVEIEFAFKIPVSWTKKKIRSAQNGELNHVIVKDLDNCVKSVTDALNEVVYHDDKQIVQFAVKKFYSDEPSITLRIKPI
jgi:Holliday junction resolvase RusA-like endonuclease